MANAVQELFDAKAAPWGAKYAADGSLRGRLERFSNSLEQLSPPPKRLLDFGCGTGNLASHLAERGYSVAACDISPAMLEAATRAFPDQGIEWKRVDPSARALPFEKAAFDVVTASSVLEYADDVDGTLRELARVLRPGGTFILTVPDVRHPIRWLERAVQIALTVEPVRRLASIPRRARSFAKYLEVSRNRMPTAEWQRAFRSAGFESISPAAVEPVSPLVLLRFRRT